LPVDAARPRRLKVPAALAVTLLVAAPGCGDDNPGPVDAPPIDAPTDAPVDAAVDAPIDTIPRLMSSQPPGRVASVTDG